jgi:hypothetical protein
MGSANSTHEIRKRDGNIPLTTRRRRWEDTIKINPKLIRFEGADCTVLAQDMGQWRALVKMVMNLRVP